LFNTPVPDLPGDVMGGAMGQGLTSQRVRDRLIERLREQGIGDERVLAVMRTLPRHLFVDEALASRAYEDSALPIGFGQTISQPWIVARMTEALLEDGIPNRVLEVGSGSGYQTALLARLVPQVYALERIPPLLGQAKARLKALGLHNVQWRQGDGSLGLPVQAPWQAILVAAASERQPDELIAQLAAAGRLIIPVGPLSGPQELMRYRKDEQGKVSAESLGGVIFVPLVREA